MNNEPSLGRGGPLAELDPGQFEVKRHHALHHNKKGGDDPPFPTIRECTAATRERSAGRPGSRVL